MSLLERVHPAVLYVLALLPAVGALRLVRAALAVPVRPEERGRSHGEQTD